jgi:hypothetical protein
MWRQHNNEWSYNLMRVIHKSVRPSSPSSQNVMTSYHDYPMISWAPNNGCTIIYRIPSAKSKQHIIQNLHKIPKSKVSFTTTLVATHIPICSFHFSLQKERLDVFPKLKVLFVITPIIKLKLTILFYGIWHDNGVDNENRWRVPFQGQLKNC